jgi:hypothetical protein
VDDVKSSCPLCPGLHTCYNGKRTMGSFLATNGKSPKPPLSSDRSLQLDCVKLESLVKADQHAALNTFPGLVHTARHTTKEGHARSS